MRHARPFLWRVVLKHLRMEGGLAEGSSARKKNLILSFLFYNVKASLPHPGPLPRGEGGRRACPPHSKFQIHSARICLRIWEGIRAVALIIYTKPGCPYCQQAREYYNSKGITFLDRDAQTNKEYRAEMFKYSGGDPTVPCIVKDGKYVQSGWGDPLRG